MKLAKRLMASRGGDPYWSNVSLCINASGADGSTSIVDAKGKSLSIYGNTQIDTSLGYPTILFDGLGDLIAIGGIPGSNLLFGNSNFTIEFLVRKIGNVANSSRLWNPDGDVYADISIGIDSAGKLTCYMSSNGSTWNLLSAPNIATLDNNVDYFVRFARDGGTLRCGINGTPYILTTALGTTSLFGATGARVIGGQYTGTSRSLNGHIRGYRITKGVARDVTEVPTLPFPTS